MNDVCFEGLNRSGDGIFMFKNLSVAKLFVFRRTRSFVERCVYKSEDVSAQD